MNLKELMQKQEPLHGDLLPYFDGQHLRHPLVYSIMHHEAMNAVMNAQYELKKTEIQKALGKKDYSQYVHWHEKPYRLQAFVNECLSAPDYWELLGDIWTGSENIWQYFDVWKQLLRSNKPGKKTFMSPDDRLTFADLPVTLTVYRGYQPGKNFNGMSYTLDKDRAMWFSTRFHKDGKVRERMIPKDRCFAYTNARDEKEIIIL